MAILKMSALPRHTRACVVRIDGDEAVQRRLIDIGLDEGRVVEFLHAGPLGDPLAFQVDERMVALRRAEAALIEVELVVGQQMGDAA